MREGIQAKVSISKFLVLPDDTTLMADGADATRVVFKVTDEFGNLLRYSTAAIALTIEGPAEMIGDNPFPLMGGCTAVWVRAGDRKPVSHASERGIPFSARTMLKSKS